LDGYRQRRLCEELGSRCDWSVERFARLQTNVQSLPFRDVRETLLALTPKGEQARRALQLLREWDGRVSGDSVGASVYELFVGAVNRRVCEIKAPRSYRYASGKGVMKLIPGTCLNARRASFVAQVVREQPPGYVDSWSELFENALAEAIETLRSHFPEAQGAKGAEPSSLAASSGWGWGEIRPLTLRHRFGDKKPLSQVFNFGPITGWGDGTTVNQASFEFWEPLRHSTVTPHLRSIIDVGDWEKSRFVLLGGQSGNPLSPHYTDLVPIYQRGEGIPVHWDDDEVRRHAVSRLTLAPSMSAKPPQVEAL